MPNFRRLFVCFMLCALGVVAHPAWAEDISAANIRIGVLAFRDKEATQTRWQPLLEYLKRSLPGWKFELQALHYPELEAATEAGQLDFVLTQPAHYVLLAYRHSLSSPLATLVEHAQGHSLDRFGGVILVRPDRPDLQQLSDLRGKTLATSAMTSLGSYQMQAYELWQYGIKLPGDAKVVETGQPQDLAIELLLKKEVDAAFVRSGVLESLIKQGKLGATDLRVLAARQSADFPLAHSTRLYPEWAMAAMIGVNKDMARQFAAALLGMPHHGETAKAIGITGFSIPHDYHPMEEMLRTLRAPPFDQTPNVAVQDVWVHYQSQITGIAILLALIFSAGSLALLFNNRRLRQTRSELETSLAQLTRNEAELRKLFMAIEQSPDSIVITNTEPRIEYVNEAFVKNTGYSRDEVIGKNPRLLSAGVTSQCTYSSLWESISSGNVWRGRLVNRRKNGEEFQENVIIAPIRDQSGNICQYIAFKQDVTHQVETEAEVYRLAHFDHLTGLCNRPLLLERISQILAQNDGRQHALMLINMDRFKALNDACGHKIGDQLLVAFGGRLVSVIEEGDTLARLSADEFALLLHAHDSSETSIGWRVMHAIEQIQRNQQLPYLLNHEEMLITSSLGIAFFPLQPYEDPNDVLRRAGTALHSAKAAGGNQAVFFDSTMGAEAEARFQVENELRRGIAQKELRLYCQSQVDASGRVLGGEILVRWQHPQRGLCSPAYFIPVAEASDLIIDLERWVIEETCRILSARQHAGQPVHLSVNVSPRHFARAEFSDWLSQLLRLHLTDPAWLTLEVTEGLVIQSIDDASEKMRKLSDLGVRFSIDDFGTGYSSLAYLKRLPIHELKIDKSFIQDAPNDPNDALLVEAILSVAKQFQLSVVAEGVETQEQAEFMNSRAEVIHQGYLFGRPEPIDSWLEKLPGPASA